MKNNLFSADFLDRVLEMRSDEQWFKSQLHSQNSRIIPIWDSMVFCEKNITHRPLFLNSNDLNNYHSNPESLILLGIYNKEMYFTINLESEKYASMICKNKHGEFIDLKQVAPLYDYQDFALLTLARFMAIWNLRHRFCGKCSKATKSLEAGNLRVCGNQLCEQQYFPSMDPAIIVLVSYDNKCLLGRQRIWPKGMYSTIAGFVEPGETIEDAVAREVCEETGISVEKIEYQASQPWLFPSSLMLGFTAHAKNYEISIAHDELEDARWFTREEIKTNLDEGITSVRL